MQKDIEQVQKLREETKKFLKASDKKEFIIKWGVTQPVVSHILSGRQLGEKSLQRLFELHERAMQRKRELTEKVNQ